MENIPHSINKPNELPYGDSFNNEFTGDSLYPQYNTYGYRVDSFKNKTVSDTVYNNVDSLANAGFCCISSIKCFCCGKTLETFDKNDDPWIKHIQLSRDCKYVASCKNKKYIESVQELSDLNKVSLIHRIFNNRKFKYGFVLFGYIIPFSIYIYRKLRKN